MTYSRRQLPLFLTALAAAEAPAQSASLPSKVYKFEDLPVRGKTRPVFRGDTHAGVPIELHITELGPGERPHPPHHHLHEEILLLKDGTLEVTISGKVSSIGPGSVVYAASNEEHGWRNIGNRSAMYFVLAIGRDTE
ncbi:MAG TPA: cupin domain-containing protein [Bryobacteraceae bacterium]|nr:cupin domain-containing protein [Bryobacteraceae bacterium]